MSIIIPANSAAGGGGYQVANSLRFDDGSSDYLRWNSSPSGNRQKFTFSVWLKRSSLTTSMIASCSYSSSDEGYLFFDSNDKLTWQTSASGMGDLKTNKVFRDLSAWYHIVLSVDTTQSTSTNRMKLYINGEQYTWDGSTTQPNQNTQIYWNVGGTYYPYIGRRSDGNYFDGYMAEIVQINNAQLAADSFGEFDSDSGVWKPLESVADLTFGDTGYYLNFQDSSALGNDVSGENHDWTSYNLAAIDQSTDTPTNNFATLNPLNYTSASKTYSFGNTAITASSSGTWCSTLSNFAVSNGKWYTEYKILSVGSYSAIGVGYQPFNFNSSAYLAGAFLVGEDTGSFGWRNNGATISNNQGGTLSSWTTNDILMIAIDMDNEKLYVGKNGTWENSGNPESGSTGTGSVKDLTAGEDYLFVICPRGGGTSVNFGSPSYTISSGNTDGNDRGNFEYAPPSGYLSLCTSNISEVLG